MVLITAGQILNAKKCGDVFSSDKNTAKMQYRELSKRYHPDNGNGNALVMAKINALFLAIEKEGWEASNKVALGGNIYHYLSENDFELGKFYVCDNDAVYVLDPRHEKYYKNAMQRVKSLKYANNKMQDEIGRFMPEIKHSRELEDRRWLIVVKKTDDMFLLSDLLEHFGGNIPAVHAAWIISRLSNICCYLGYMGLAHNGISLNNCFVSPKQHTIALLGGWWYCVKQGEKMIGTQRAIYDLMLDKKMASPLPDLESAKAIGRGLSKDYPKAIIKFLHGGSSDNPVTEFGKWSDALTEAFGPRRFIKLDIAKDAIYKKRGDF